jgi:hypothetical protein
VIEGKPGKNSSQKSSDKSIYKGTDRWLSSLNTSDEVKYVRTEN